MKCPFCSAENTQVKDSRISDEGTTIRRRRFCGECGGRFTTYERVQLREIEVVKRNGDTKPFDSNKITRSIQIAMRKRPHTNEQIEHIVSNIVKEIESIGENQISSRLIGQKIMEELAKTDQVAYIRYASVYSDFKEAKDFEKFIEGC